LLCAAWTVNGVSTGGKGHSSDALAEAVGLDMAEWWEATGEEYLSRVSKAMIASAVSEAGMADESVLLGKLKKGEAVAKAEALLAGKRWLPALLRTHL
jgi:ParB family transcriptional regulator, chromosome partitioning protein